MPSKDQEKVETEAPLDRAGLQMVAAYRRLRHVYKAAEKAHVPRSRALKVFHSAAFQDELERQEEAVRLERAKLEAQTEKLTNEVIDRELLRVILLDVEKHGSLKLDGIRLGAVMQGRIQAGNTRSLESAGGAPSGSGNFYQAFVQVQEAAPILPVETPAPPPVAANPAPAVAAASSVARAAARPQTPPKTPNAPKGAIRLG